MRIRPCGEQLALVGEIRGEERDQQDLGDLAGLEAERTEADPEPTAAVRLTDDRAGGGAA